MHRRREREGGRATRDLRKETRAALYPALFGGVKRGNTVPHLGVSRPRRALVHLYVVRVEEPRLVERFGADYAAYARRVPRWLPRRPR